MPLSFSYISILGYFHGKGYSLFTNGILIVAIIRKLFRCFSAPKIFQKIKTITPAAPTREYPLRAAIWFGDYFTDHSFPYTSLFGVIFQ